MTYLLCCFLQVQADQTAATPSPMALMPLPSTTPPQESLPPQWKSAKDPSGKVYYYHSITRKTQWDRPGSQDRGDITMELATPEQSSGEEDNTGQQVGHVTVM